MKTLQSSALGVALLLSLCPAVRSEPPPEPEKAHVTIEGSNTFGEELGPKLIRAFTARNPSIRVALGTQGSAAGFSALLNGECNLAASSRVLNEDEHRMARARKLRLRSHFLGTYGISVIVNRSNPIQSLSDAQVRDAFTGAIANWKELGGGDTAIQVFIRDPVSGTHLGFQELAMSKQPYAPAATPLKSYAEILEAVGKSPGAIGYAGMTLVPQDGKVRSVSINGLPPNAVSVNEGLYPYARGLRFYTVSGKEPAEVLEFIRFVRGKEGQKELEREGYVPRDMQPMDQGGFAF